MKKTIFLVIGLALVMAIRAYAFDDGDFQVWHTEAQDFKVNDKVKLTLEEEARLGDGGGNFFYQHYDGGIVYGVNKHLDLGLNYRQVYEKKGSDFKEENRLHMNATLKSELWGFKFDDRNRLEYRHFDWQEDSWRYRNKFTVKTPGKFTRWHIQPYLSDEIFIKLNGIALNRNRLYSGVAFNIFKNLKGEIFYLWQESKSSGKWTTANVLGSKLKLSF